MFLTVLTFFFWLEVLFRGIILRLLLNRYSRSAAIFLNTIIYWLWISFIMRSPILSVVMFILIGFVNAYVTTKTNSLLSSFVFSIIISLSFFTPLWAFFFII